MEVIEIPTTVLFEEMLKKLGLPSPTYKARMSEEAKLVASITFFFDNSMPSFFLWYHCQAIPWTVLMLQTMM